MIVRNLSSKQMVIFLAGLLATGLVFWAIGQMDSSLRWPLAAVLVAVIAFVCHRRARLNESYRPALVGALLGMTITFGLLLALRMYRNVLDPSEWDFQSFWLFGQVAAAKYNLYDPRHYTQIATSLGLSPSREFVVEIVNVGFVYPPPTAFLFLPLSWFESMSAALLAWYVVQGLMLIATIYLSWSIFLRGSGKLGLLLAATTLLALWPTWRTVSDAQTNFAMLSVVLLFWRDRHSPRAGVWLVVGTVIKPFVAGLSLYLLLRKNWKALLAAVAATIAVTIVTVLGFGSETFVSYFTAGPTSRVPEWVYTEGVNQSLLATVLRLTQADLSHTSPLAKTARTTTGRWPWAFRLFCWCTHHRWRPMGYC
jgi:hypothetical protein